MRVGGGRKGRADELQRRRRVRVVGAGHLHRAPVTTNEPFHSGFDTKSYCYVAATADVGA